MNEPATVLPTEDDPLSQLSMDTDPNEVLRQREMNKESERKKQEETLRILRSKDDDDDDEVTFPHQALEEPNMPEKDDDSSTIAGTPQPCEHSTPMPSEQSTASPELYCSLKSQCTFTQYKRTMVKMKKTTDGDFDCTLFVIPIESNFQMIVLQCGFVARK